MPCCNLLDCDCIRAMRILYTVPFGVIVMKMMMMVTVTDADSRRVSSAWSLFARTKNGKRLAQPQKPTSKTSSD